VAAKLELVADRGVRIADTPFARIADITEEDWDRTLAVDPFERLRAGQARGRPERDARQ
jgi:hypothetical protein